MAWNEDSVFYFVFINELHTQIERISYCDAQRRHVSQVKTTFEHSDQTPGSLSAQFPALFIERLVKPLFAAPARAARAEAFLGAPLAYACARMCHYPKHDLDALHGRAAYESIRSRRTRSRAIKLIGELAADGIDAVAFKGLATALSAYSYPAYRLLPDVDILFREADLPKLAKCLAAWGYATDFDQQALRAWGALTEASFAPIFQSDRTFFLDVHRAVNERPASLGLDTELMFARADRIETEWGSCLVASLEHSFAIAALNLYRDFYRPEALKGLFDGCLILNRFGDRLDWAHIEAVARHGRFVNRLVFFRELLEALGGGRAPLFEDRSLAGWLRPSLAVVVENCRSLDWLAMSDYRKILLEIGLLDSPLATLHLHWHRLRSIAATPSHYLPGVPVIKAGERAGSV